jgi:hypothetical protein
MQPRDTGQHATTQPEIEQHANLVPHIQSSGPFNSIGSSPVYCVCREPPTGSGEIVPSPRRGGLCYQPEVGGLCHQPEVGDFVSPSRREGWELCHQPKKEDCVTSRKWQRGMATSRKWYQQEIEEGKCHQPEVGNCATSRTDFPPARSRTGEGLITNAVPDASNRKLGERNNTNRKW